MTINTLPRIIAILTAALVLSSVAAAGGLEDYRSRLDAAEVAIESMMDTASPRNTAHEREQIETIRKLVPDSERVEWQDGSIETANRWLHSDLESFLAEPDSAKRAEILSADAEKLKGISKSIAAVQSANRADQTKDAEKRKLGEILERPEYQPAKPADESLFQRWLREFQEWLDRVFPATPNTPTTASGMGPLKVWLQVLVYALVLGLVGFLVYRFLPFFSRRFKDRKAAASGDRVILGERVSADESAADLFAEAEQLARQGDLRGAIRKGYIALLCELSDRKVIGLARHKTNRDYLRDLRKRTDILESVGGMTLNYERNWYGLRPAEAEDWEEFRLKYRETLGAVK